MYPKAAVQQMCSKIHVKCTTLQVYIRTLAVVHNIRMLSHTIHMTRSPYGILQYLSSHHLLVLPCECCSYVGRIQLCQAVDKNKDQTYFLSTLDQKQLQRVLFPVGDLMKADVKGIANMEGLHDVAARKEVRHLLLSCTMLYCVD